jgi:GxxExxY protein
MISREFTHDIIRIAMHIHSQLGPGLLESAYQEALYYCLKKEGYKVEKEKPMPLVFEGVQLDCGYRIDLLIEEKLVLELKSVKTLNDVHLAQLLTYLKLGHFELGYLLNFNVAQLKNGIKRVINSR